MRISPAIPWVHFLSFTAAKSSKEWADLLHFPVLPFFKLKSLCMNGKILFLRRHRKDILCRNNSFCIILCSDYQVLLDLSLFIDKISTALICKRTFTRDQSDSFTIPWLHNYWIEDTPQVWTDIFQYDKIVLHMRFHHHIHLICKDK